MRINVTGNPGAGKSTLARRLAQGLGAPLIEMDRIVWDPGWRKVPKEEQMRRLTPLIDGESWVVDGVSRKARERADIIILLDYPRHVCAWRCVRRAAMHGFGTREGMPTDCPEWKIAPTLFRIIFDFPNSARKIILADLKERDMRDLIITKKSQIDDLFENGCYKEEGGFISLFRSQEFK